MANAQILVVEDEPIVAKNIQMELKGMGYTVPAIASSGEDALQKVAETHPDLVLMDIVLKGDMDGVETAERLRESYDVPVIYLTAYADDQTLQRAKKTQPFGYLLKPYEEKELETTIETALYKHQSERGLKEIQQWFASTLRCIRDAVIATDARGCVRIFNHSAVQLTGWSQEEALGKDLLNVFIIVNGETLT
ncbi:MAG TPA: response regulator, partial [Gemmataceae bacterium]|nr:response regulator [Gemmataceae bacterium]